MNYKPKLKAIKVPLSKLILDPNNPRFLSQVVERTDEKHYADPGVQIETSERMASTDYKVTQLIESIKKNGWQPVDMIFVRKHPEGYVVLEGNRRVTALRQLTKPEAKDVPKELKAEVDPLEVLEVQGTGDEVEGQISYLLGVRHHGSLKAWGAFAQAHNIYERYLRVGNMTDDTFQWNKATALRLAATLGVEETKVEERIKVYRVMKQINALPAVAKVDGIEGRYYSLIREVLDRPKSKLREYIVQDAKTFLLDQEGLKRMDNLCHFSTKNRDKAPIQNPGEWRSLERILKDEDATKRAELLKRVEQAKERPSVVYADRAAELRTPRWDNWLKEVAALLGTVKVADLEVTAEAKTAAAALAKIIETLDAKKKRSSSPQPTKVSERSAKATKPTKPASPAAQPTKASEASAKVSKPGQPKKGN